MKIEHYYYEIDENNAVKIWDETCPNEENLPFFYQPEKPDGKPWNDKAEVEAWTENFIKDLLKPLATEELSETIIKE
jgi:hypothetical protein